MIRYSWIKFFSFVFLLLCALPGQATNPSTWMTDNQKSLSSRQLNQIAIPGAHDAGSYGINLDITTWAKGEIAPDITPQNLTLFSVGKTMGIMQGWARTQSKNPLQMLNDGIRYFDLRLCVDKNDQFLTCHSLYGAPLKDFIDAAKAFADKYPKEIIILSFNAFSDVAVPGGYNSGLTPKHWDTLKTFIKSELTGKLVKNNFSGKSTLGELWSQPGSIIVNFSRGVQDSIKTADPEIWHGAEAAGTWIQSTDISQFKKETSAVLNRTNPDSNQFFVFNAVVTPDTQMILRRFLLGGPFPETLVSLTDMTTPVIINWIKDDWQVKPNSGKINVIRGDYYERTELVQLAFYLNGLQNTLSAPKVRTSWFNWNCPEGYRDDGLYCFKPEPYGRGTGYVIWDEKKCIAENTTTGCEQSGALWYPKCRANFHPVGCCICSPDCPQGMSDIGISCKK